MVAAADKPLLAFDAVEEWERWLSGDADSAGVRLRLRKKSSRLIGITYAEALDVALCFGWIDGRVKSLDDDYFTQVFTPRRPSSVWSKRNRDYVDRLTAAGRMRPEGIAEVDRAKADGRWDAAYRQQDAAVPPDLQTALDASPTAAAFFATLTSQNRFAIVFRLDQVKRAETRAKKLATYITMLERGETLHPQRKSDPKA